VGTVFQFHLTGPDSSWVLDAKNGKGSVTAGTASADVTLTLSDADFLDMTSGKADAQKLYFGGKLKIAGNIMASQKLFFLKKVDPQAALAAIQKARGAAPAPAAPAAPAAPPPPAAAAPDKLTSADVFVAIRDYVEKTPDLVAK